MNNSLAKTKSMRILIFTISIIVTSCLTSREITDTNVSEIHFGHGGGFTGEVNEYKLSSSGGLFQSDSELKNISRKSTLNYFEQAEKLTDYTFNEPENMYYFIEIISNEKTNRLVWHAGSKVDKRLTDLYNGLLLELK